MSVISDDLKNRLIHALTDEKAGVELESLLEAIVNDINSLQSYSLTETDTGKKWVDDKPIFRKVFVIPAQANNNQDFQAIGVTIEALISVGGFVNDGANILMLPVPIPNSNDSVVGVAVVSDGITLQVHTGSAGAHDGGFVILEYTKV